MRRPDLQPTSTSTFRTADFSDRNASTAGQASSSNSAAGVMPRSATTIPPTTGSQSRAAKLRQGFTKALRTVTGTQAKHVQKINLQQKKEAFDQLFQQYEEVVSQLRNVTDKINRLPDPSSPFLKMAKQHQSINMTSITSHFAQSRLAIADNFYQKKKKPFSSFDEEYFGVMHEQIQLGIERAKNAVVSAKETLDTLRTNPLPLI